MDQVKIGAFIAQLRRERDWTQEELGERLGVTNKTVSRWENGNYMPSIELLALMGREFDVSLNELLEGRRLDDEAEFRAAADEKLTDALRSPGERLWRWLERYGAFPAVTALLCVVILLCFRWQHSYAAAHPVDVAAEGSWCTDWSGTGDEEYLVLVRGEYYRYRQFEPLEYGRYTVDGPLVTVETRERRFQAVIKGHSIYAPGGEGRMSVYQKDMSPGDSRIGVFINVSPDDFEK